MRLLLILLATLVILPARADPPVATDSAPSAHTPGIDLSTASVFSARKPGGTDTSSVLLGAPASPFGNDTGSFGPILNVGPIHARLGSMESERGHGRIGGVEFDTSDFLHSRLAASVSSHSARLVFSVPVP